MHVVVTGASSGIGEAIAREFARAGDCLTLVARRRERLDALAAEVGVATHVVTADLSDPAQATSWIAAAEAANGPIDVLVNNAGVQIVARTTDTTADDGDRLLRLNVMTPLRTTLAVLPGMLARRSGTIVDVASLAGIAPTPGMFYYSASKAGLAAASEALRGELRGTGVHVVTVYPGPVKTDMADAAHAALGSPSIARRIPEGTVDVLARRVRQAVLKRHARIIYPRIYRLARWFPGITRYLMDRMTPLPPPKE